MEMTPDGTTLLVDRLISLAGTLGALGTLGLLGLLLFKIGRYSGNADSELKGIRHAMEQLARSMGLLDGRVEANADQNEVAHGDIRERVASIETKVESLCD